MLGCKGIDFPRIRLFVYYSLKSPKAFYQAFPLWTQKSVFGLAALLAKVTGVERRLKKYQAD